MGRRLDVHVVQGSYVPHPDLSRGHQPGVNPLRQLRGDDVSPPPDENYMPKPGKVEDGLGRVLHQGPRRGVQPEEFFDRILEVRGHVFRHEPLQGLRQIVFREHFFNQIPVEHRPRRGLFPVGDSIQTLGDELRHRHPPGPSLAGNRNKRAVPPFQVEQPTLRFNVSSATSHCVNGRDLHNPIAVNHFCIAFADWL